MTLLYRSSWRYLLKHPLQLLFSILGVALGVAIVVGIDLASHSARQGFYLSTQSLAGNASHRIIHSQGALPEGIYTQLRNDFGLQKITPLIKQTVKFKDNRSINISDEQLIDVQLTGIDPFSEAEIRAWQQKMLTSLSGDKLQRLLTEPDAVLLAADFLHRHRLNIGDQITLIINNKAVQLTIIGSFKAPEAYQSQVRNWIICDISTAQELLNFQGYLSQIDLLLDKNNDKLSERIKAILPQEGQLLEAKEHSRAIARLSHSFELNLTALSLLGLLVAMFLIYNTMMFSVVQRRDLIARMRVIGVARMEVFRLIIVEAFLIAVIATGAGLVIGWFLAHVLLYFVTRTINDLYYVLQVTQLYWSQFTFYKAISLGITTTLIAALLPALEASLSKPVKALHRSELESKILIWSRWLLLPGLLGCLLVYLLLQAPLKELAGGMLSGFATVFLLIIALICLLPYISHYLLKLLAVVMKQWFLLPGKMAVNNIARSFSRSIVAIAALTVSVSAALGIGIMVDSFRTTVDDWLTGYLKADYFITTTENNSPASAEPLDAALRQALWQLSGVKFVSSNQEVRFYSNGQYHNMMVLDIPAESFSAFRLKEGDPSLAKSAWLQQDAVIISEPYAYRHGLSSGDILTLPVNKNGNTMQQAFKIVAVYYHYGSEHGVITMSRSTYNRHWPLRRLDTLGVYLTDAVMQEPSKIKQLQQQLQKIVDERGLTLVSKQDIHKKSLIIFDRTFNITNVLKFLVVLVSFVGILSALMAIELERAREFAILRATGLTARQLSLLIYLETLVMGIVAAILAMPMGIALAYLLIEVVNYRSFGWSMQFVLPWHEFVMAGSLALLAALLAGFYPARHLGKIQPAVVLRGE